MKHSKIINLLTSAVLTFTVGAVAPVSADDTEIYLNSASSTAPANLLFNLDTSGSMGDPVDENNNGVIDAGERSRIVVLKEAMNAVLDSLPSLNAGIMRYHYHGGPILYPIAGIDKLACEVEGTCAVGAALAGGNQVVTNVLNSGSDDAEEQDALTVVLDRPALDIGQRPAGSCVTVNGSIRVEDDRDDAESFVANNTFKVNSSDLELPREDGNQQIIGIRFEGVPIPQGATVTNAQLVFEIDDVSKAGSQQYFRPIDLLIHGENIAGPRNSFSNGAGREPEDRALTAAVVQWATGEFPFPDQLLKTTNLSAILNELVSDPAWNPTAPGGDDMVFLIRNNPAAPPTATGSREVESHDGESSAAPLLTFTYETCANAVPSNIRTGLRFDGVAIPQGSTITSARIDFVATTAEGDNPGLRIKMENTDDAAPFAVGTPFSPRTATPAGTAVGWDLSTTPPLDGTDLNWEVDTTYATPDLKDMVQAVVNRAPVAGVGGWCGGNAMMFSIERIGGDLARRSAYSLEGDSTKAPVLTITYDADNPQPGANGCIESTIVKVINAGNDDAEEKNDGSMDLTSTDLEMVEEVAPNSSQKIGIRFDDIPIEKDALIKSAKLVFTVDELDSGATSLTFKGQLSSNAQPFSTSANNISNTTARPRTIASLAWSPPAFATIDQTIELTGLEGIVQEIVNQGGWVAGNALAFLINSAGTDTGKRVASSFDLSPTRAPRLVITFQGTPTSSQKTVRTRLKEIVSGLIQRGGTPIAGSMLEAAYYYRGEAVRFGRQRGDQSAEDKVTNVSHSASYSANGSTVTFPGNCNESDQQHPDCKTQVISGGTPTYKSPIIAECQSNYLINLTDGGGYYTGDGASNTLGQSIDEQPLINAFTAEDPDGDPISLGNCNSNTILPDGGGTFSGTPHDECTVKLAKFLHDNDQIFSASQNLQSGSAPIGGTQTIETFTIGFNLCGTGNVTSLDSAGDQVCCAAGNHSAATGICSSPLTDPTAIEVMKAQAAVGGGEYFNANTVDELVAAFTNITSKILEKSTSFVAPSIAANAFNRLFSRDEVFFGLFEPSRQPRWVGNVKKYSICIIPDPDLDGVDNCVLGDVLDFDGDPAIVDVPGAPDDGLFDTNAQSIWSGGLDGRATKIGGAGAEITNFANRLIYTDVRTFDGQASNGALLSNSGFNVTSANWDVTANAAVRDQVCPDPSVIVAGSDCEKRMLWMLGKDVLNEDQPLSTTTRWWFHDVLHSSPIAVTYGKDLADNFIDKILVGTNDGGLHFINGTTGEEEWMFIPNALLAKQPAFFDNSSPQHKYGLDATPVIGVFDNNQDGTIDPAATPVPDAVHVFITQRRGGNNMYALDISPNGAKLDASSGVASELIPKFLWHISSGTEGFSRLGETWSEPVISTIKTADNSEVRVLIFGGGYDSQLDLGDGSGIARNFGVEGGDPNQGNAIYIVDAATGDLIFSISAALPVTVPPSTEPAPDIIVDEMKFSIPSNVTVLDSDGDGFDDRVYVGDTAGQLWRVDLVNVDPGGPKPEGDSVVGLLANISNAGTLTEERRFFYKPAVVQVIDNEFSNAANGEYDYVLIGTGNRANPLDSQVQDRFYAFRDVTTGVMQGDADNNAVDYPKPLPGTPGGTPGDPIVDDGTVLVDITSAAFEIDPLTGTAPAATKQALGWFFNFEAAGRDGEKVLAASSVFGGTLIFTTYVPDDPAAIDDICSAAEGSGLAYNLNILTTKAAIDWDEDGTLEPLADRTAKLGTGIPSEGVPIFTKEGVTVLVGTGGGAENIGKVSELPRFNTYWYEEP